MQSINLIDTKQCKAKKNIDLWERKREAEVYYNLETGF